jgi:hypothetical protein
MTLYCPICNKNPALKGAAFCNKHCAAWVDSPERASVDWESVDSYNFELSEFIKRAVIQSEFIQLTEENSKLILSAFQLKPEDLLP